MHENASQADSFDQLWTGYWLDVQAVGPLTSTRFRLMRGEILLGRHRPHRILDIGCGPGRFLSMLAAAHPGATIQGVEPSGDARDAAPAMLRERILLGPLEFHLEVLRTYQPDLVVCSEVLEHVPDPDAVMRDIAALAAPGALLVFTVPAGMSHWSVQDDEAGHLRRFELDEFEALLCRHGLVPDRLYTWGGPISWLYNRLLNRVGPRRAAHSSRSRLGRLAAHVAILALQVDDLFKGRDHFQLIASARKPIAADR